MATDMFDHLTRLTMNPINLHWNGATDARVAFHLHRINTVAQTRMGVVVSPDPINVETVKAACKHIHRSKRSFRVMPIGVYRNHVMHQLMLIIDGRSGFLFDPHGDFGEDARCLKLLRRLLPGVHVSRRVCGSSVGPQWVEERAGARGERHGTGHCAAWCLLLVEMIARTGCDVQSAARAIMHDEDGVARTPTHMKRAISAYSQQLMLIERQSEIGHALNMQRWLTNDL